MLGSFGSALGIIALLAILRGAPRLRDAGLSLALRRGPERNGVAASSPALARERAVGPKKRATMSGITRHGIYTEARKQTQRLAIEWFDKHLRK